MKLPFFLVILTFIVLPHRASSQAAPKHYITYHIEDSQIQFDGIINDSIWKLASWTDYFIDIQGANQISPRHETRVKMLWSDSFLYIAAYLAEPHIWANITKDEEVMFYDNDFEVFIDPDGDNHNYYEFEFNALNKKWDLFLDRPYRNRVIPDLKWECKGLKNQTLIYGTINNPRGNQDSAWTLEIAIPIDCIQQGVQDQDVWRINFSRVQWQTKISGNKYKKLKKPEDNWVWSPQWSINMHKPEYWGYLQFSQNKVGAKNADSIKDVHWNTKMKLMRIHYFENSYYKINERYSSEIPSNLVIPNLHSEIHKDQYIISVTENNCIWNVNEKGRLWESKNDKSPKFWVWMHPNIKYNVYQWDSVFTVIHELGIRGVLMGANTEVIKRIIPIAEKYDIQIHAWMWAMNRGDAPKEYMSVNDLGKSLAEEKAYVDYYKFMSPVLPEVNDFIKAKTAMLERIDGLSGIHMDYIRYVDVFLPKGLLPKYNLTQDSIMPEFDYGYHPKMIEAFETKYGKSPLSIPDYKNDSLWQQFRMDQVSNIVNDLSQEFATKELSLSAAVFPDPQMSREMVRQDWGTWKLDYYFPMVYNGFYNAGTFWIEERMRVSKQYLPESIIICGLYLPQMQSQEIFNESLEAAFSGGANGIALFDFRALKEQHKTALKKAIEKYGVWIEN